MNHEVVEILRLKLNNTMFVPFKLLVREVFNHIFNKILVSFTSNEEGF